MVAKAVELAQTHGWFLTRQFENEANADFHSRTTAREIVTDFAGERLDYWVTGFGTGGTLKGVARVLAKERPETRIVLAEPADAPIVTSGTRQERNADGSPAARHPAWKPHPIQGWSPDFLPKLAGDAVDAGQVHRVITVPKEDAMRWSRAARVGRRNLRRHLGRRHLRGGDGGGQGRCPGLHDPLHAARHRRALSHDTAVRRHPGRHDGRGDRDPAIHGRPSPRSRSPCRQPALP